MFQDAFFYCLVFDPSQKTLLADKGEIRVGSRYQTEVTNLLKEGKNNTFFFIIFISINIHILYYEDLTKINHVYIYLGYFFWTLHITI